MWSDMLEKRRHDRLPPSHGIARHVTEVGLLARSVLQSGSDGVVMAAFQRCFYAAFGDHLICVGSHTLGSGPLHVLCDRWQDDLVDVGQPVAIEGTALRVDGAVLADFEIAPTWWPDPAPRWSLASLAAGLQAIDAIWRMTFGGEALVPDEELVSGRSSHLIAAARLGVDALARIVGDGLQDSRSDATAGADVIGLIGLGPGLTPSGDDVLLGALVALGALELPQVRDTLWRQCQPSLDRTNAISRAHLEAAAGGYGAAVLHAAIHATIAGRVAELDRVLAAVSEVGETSGRDAFTGALVALRTVRRHVAAAARTP